LRRSSPRRQSAGRAESPRSDIRRTENSLRGKPCTARTRRSFSPAARRKVIPTCKSKAAVDVRAGPARRLLTDRLPLAPTGRVLWSADSRKEDGKLATEVQFLGQRREDPLSIHSTKVDESRADEIGRRNRDFQDSYGTNPDRPCCPRAEPVTAPDRPRD